MRDLAPLIKRLASLKAADRETDALLWAEFDNRDVHIVYGEVIARERNGGHDIRLGFVDPSPRTGNSNFYGWDGPAYTANMDATLEFVERILPVHGFAPDSPPSSGWKIGLYRGMTPTGAKHGCWDAMVRPHGGDAGYDHRAPTPSLALLQAALSALHGYGSKQAKDA